MSEQQNNAVDGANHEQQGAQFNIQRIYTKDISFESPNAPAIFAKEWQPEVQLDLDTRSVQLEEGLFEVVLKVTTTAKVGDETAFLVEVHQAGIFSMSNDMPDQQKAHMIGAFIPNLLFPYARECVANLVNRGTFPALNLAPVNFDAIFAAYMQKRAQEAQAQQGGEGSVEH